MDTMFKKQRSHVRKENIILTWNDNSQEKFMLSCMYIFMRLSKHDSS